jgi:hypothetical protein
MAGCTTIHFHNIVKTFDSVKYNNNDKDDFMIYEMMDQ